MKSLAVQQRSRFVIEARKRLRELFPEELEKFNSEMFPIWVENEVKNAKQYGLETEVDVQRFLELSFHFGSDIQTDPQLGWVRTKLVDTGLEPAERLDAVYSELMLKEL